MKTPLLFLMLLVPFGAMAQGVATRATNGLVKGLTILGTTTNLAVGANKIIVTGPQGQEKGAALSGLTFDGTTIALYVAPTITSFVNNQNIVEIGATVTSTILDWTLSGGAITSQSINNSIGALAIGLRTYTDPDDYTTNRTYTLTVGDGTSTVQASTTVSLQNPIFWGAAEAETLDDDQIKDLSSALATTRLQTRSIITADSYIYFAWPESFSLGTFKVGGLPDIGWTFTTNAFVNASGYSSSYILIRHNLLLPPGTYTVEVE